MIVRPISNWTLKRLTLFAPAFVLAIIVRRNYKLRMQGLLPDKWHWADAMLLSWGFVVKAPRAF